MSELSPHAIDARAVLCEACGRPQMVAARVPQPVEVECVYCGRAQTRGLGDRGEGSYRAPAARAVRGASGARVSFDLRETPRGFEVLTKRGARAAEALARFEALRPELARAPAEARDLDAEWRLVWLGGLLASLAHIARDFVRERALLEATLEHATHPAYRALVLARLARLAASGGGVELAEAWMSMAPERTGIREADGDLETARAYLELRRGAPQAALDRLGQEETSTIAGSARVVADLVRVEALERLGRRAVAYGLYRLAVRAHGQRVSQSVAARYGLAQKSAATFVRVGCGMLLFLIALVTIVWIALEQRRHVGLLLVLDVLLVGLVLVLFWFRRKVRVVRW